MLLLLVLLLMMMTFRQYSEFAVSDESSDRSIDRTVSFLSNY
jgi:hypothetical protein